MAVVNDGGVNISVDRILEPHQLAHRVMYHVTVDDQTLFVYGRWTPVVARTEQQPAVWAVFRTNRAAWHRWLEASGFAVPDPVDNNIIRPLVPDRQHWGTVTRSTSARTRTARSSGPIMWRVRRRRR
jgi:hypothetical protein